jgi:hypothetical protein
MTRPIAFYGIVLGLVACAACGGDPQAPTGPLAPATTPPAVAPPQVMPPRTGASDNSLAGSYALTLEIGSGCAALPSAERTRRYTAAIDRSGERYVVTLGGATFLTGPICTGGGSHYAGIGCQQFFASQDGDTARFFLENNNDDAHGGHIVEQSPSGAWLEVIGEAGGRLDPSSIEASGVGTVWYCPTRSSYPFPCERYVFCTADMRLTLKRTSAP